MHERSERNERECEGAGGGGREVIEGCEGRVEGFEDG